jgi:hypothetical protein
VIFSVFLADPQGLMALAVRIQARARTFARIERADMLLDNPEDG